MNNLIFFLTMVFLMSIAATITYFMGFIHAVEFMRKDVEGFEDL